MNLLTATHERQGEQCGDFSFAVEGELVLLGEVCAADRTDPGGGCGCGRAFTGMGSQRGTTTAMVRDLELSFDDLRFAVEGHHLAAGLGPGVLGQEAYEGLVADSIIQMYECGRAWPAGTVVGRRLDQVRRRAVPQESAGQ